ncbi:hypothetical protein DFJ58DRAFT_850653, partial [Suillus subalutaceus]|uniref:uncharacterized protein n=1 Tax=Suillus subalutaceus TaxID=48586 RepID=UPI001B8819C6
EFSKIWRKVVTMVDAAAAKHGFEAVFIICGKVVNQDRHLGIYTKRRVQKNFGKHAATDEDAMIGHLKAHVYNLASLAVAEDMHLEGAPSAKEDEPPRKRKSSKVSTDAPEAVKDDPDAPEVLDVDDWQLQVDLLPLIKGGIIALLKEVGGKLTVRSGNFPWKKLRSDLDRQGFVIEGYLEDILMPGETRSTSARSKGINDLDKREQIILAEALKSGTLVIKCGPSGSEDKDKSRPVIIGEAPPPHSAHLRPSRLRPSAATTKVRKPNRQAAPIASSIVVDDDSPTSPLFIKKSRRFSRDTSCTPFEASSGLEEDDSAYDDAPQVESDYEDRVQSRKRKAKTTGGTRRLKRRVLSSDIEVIEPQPKGKAKDTALQKERLVYLCDSEMVQHSKPKPKKISSRSSRTIGNNESSGTVRSDVSIGSIGTTGGAAGVTRPSGAAEPSGAEVAVVEGRNYPQADLRRNQIDYQRMNQGPGGSNTAGYSHTQYTPRNDITRVPAHQQRLEDYDTRALVPSQQQQYPEIYGCAPTRAPSEQQQHMENYGARAPAPGYDKQQHMENYGARAPAPTYDTRVPAPQQGLVAHRDGRVAYNMDERWQPHYGPMAHQAKNVLQTPRRSSQRMSPLPGLVAYSSSPPQSEYATSFDDSLHTYFHIAINHMSSVNEMLWMFTKLC